MSEAEIVAEVARLEREIERVRRRFEPSFAALHARYSGDLSPRQRSDYKNAYLGLCKSLMVNIDVYSVPRRRLQIQLKTLRYFRRKAERAGDQAA